MTLSKLVSDTKLTLDKKQRAGLLHVLTTMFAFSWIMEMASQLQMLPFKGEYQMPIWLISIISGLMGITITGGIYADLNKPCKDAPNTCPRRLELLKKAEENQ